MPVEARPLDGGQRERLAARMKAYRRAARISQEELAQRAGLSVSLISTIERATRTRIAITALDCIAEGMGMTADELVAVIDDGDEPQPRHAMTAAEMALLSEVRDELRSLADRVEALAAGRLK